MNSNRRILKAHRRWNSYHGGPSTSDGKHGNVKERAPSKNIASARMKRLRESLSNDLAQNSSNVSDTEPPPKRNCLPAPPAEAPSSVHCRLKIAANSTPLKRAQSSVSSRQFGCLSPFRSSPYRQIKRVSESSETQLNTFGDEDVAITDISQPSINASSSSNTSLECHPNTSVREEINDDDIDMDWSPVEEIRQARELIIRSQPVGELSKARDYNVNIKSPLLGMSPMNVYIVVDTNIFIDKMQTLTNIMQLYFKDESYPVIFVPWMVIQELDYFKDGYSLSEKHPISKTIQVRCRKAIKFINDCLLAKKNNFRGQPVHQAANSTTGIHNPDDSILACCIQLQLERLNVILLSSDINLRNKALISNIKACSPVDIIKELTKNKTTTQCRNFVNEISKKLSLICSFILHFEIHEHLGERLYLSKGFKKLPWIFKDCVLYLHEYYDSVFGPKMQKQCRKIINDLHELFTSGEEIMNDVKFMENCLSLLIYLQSGFPKYDSNIQGTIKEIKDLEDEFLH